MDKISLNFPFYFLMEYNKEKCKKGRDPMNKRAERFKKFIADQKVEGFTIEEPKSEPNNLVLFRSNFRMDGNLLPFGIFVDDTRCRCGRSPAGR